MNDTRYPLAKYIDHTILKPDAVANDLKRLCREAKEFGFYSVCVNGCNVAACASELSDSDVLVCGVVGFPLGAMCTDIKLAECKRCLADGAKEIDMVLNVGALKSGQFDVVQREIASLADLCHTDSAKLKVIIETCLLSDDEKRKACELSVLAGADFVKTSTGFSTGGATIDDLKLMRSVVGAEVGVKASGGVKPENIWSMIEAASPGPVRVGASASVAIVTNAVREGL
ncbi:deoxyribose-phosphate aldolase [Oligoflexia bacterium]|nr:deoxyribose-phosphate aldolase [Oligoflexia bacterium]